MIRLRKKIVLILLPLLVSCFLSGLPYASAYTGTITYSAGSKTITAYGGTSGSPITFSDVYSADVAGGWGVITRQANNQFNFADVTLQLGDGTQAHVTYFADNSKQVMFTGTGSNDFGIKVTSNTYLTLGLLADLTSKRTYSGCHLRFVSYSASSHPICSSTSSDVNQSIYLYGSTLRGGTFYGIDTISSTTELRAINCIFDGGMPLICKSTNATVYNILVTNGYGGLIDVAATVQDRITVMGCSGYGLRFQSGASNWTVSNLVAVGNTYLIRKAGAADQFLVNPTVDTWAFNWDAGATGKIYRQYQYDLVVLNGDITDFVEDANVTLTKNDVLVGNWLTNSSGQIDTQTLTYGFYNQTGGDTMYDGSDPFVLMVTHPDWATYTSRFYVTEKTKMTISMQEVAPSVTPDPEVYQTVEEGLNFTIIAAFFIALVGAVILVIILRRNS